MQIKVNKSNQKLKFIINNKSIWISVKIISKTFKMSINGTYLMKISVIKYETLWIGIIPIIRWSINSKTI